MPENDEQYKAATKTVVDDAMRTDQLGPSIVRVFEDHKPANDKVQQIMLEAVKNNSVVQNSLSAFITNDATMKKGKLIDRVVNLGLAAVVTVIIGFLAKLAGFI